MTALNRRAFLASAAGALKAAAPQVKVGAHPWVYAARQPDRDPTPVLDQIFKETGAAGLDGIELMHTILRHDGAVERIAALSRQYKLPVIGTSWSGNLWKRAEHGQVLDDAALVMGRLAQLKGTTLGTSVGSAGHKKTEAEFDAQAECLRKVMEIARRHGVVVNLHNHVYEVQDGEHDLNGTLKRIPEAKLGPDLGWLYRAKVDPVDFIRRHGKRMVFAHLRDEKADGKWPEAVGEGVMDFAAIGKALREVNFRGWLVIELAHEKDFQPTRSYGESFRLSREHVRRAMGY